MILIFRKLSPLAIEIPITFKDREKGTSKMSSDIIREAAKGVLKIRSKHKT
jgi:hypothetical protein